MADADLIFTGGPILTMERARPRAEAIAVAGGRILAAGSRDDVLALRAASTRVVDLAGRALLPGFVDGHGHLGMLAGSVRSANLAVPPVGAVTGIPSLQAELRAHIQRRGIPPGEWVRGHGYDNAFMAEGRHPTREDLDAVSREHPIYLSHVSAHLSAANSLALELAGVTAASQDPPGGVIRRRPGSNEPDGVFEENAMGAFSQGVIPLPSEAEQLEDLVEAQRVYASYGITTAQEGAMFPPQRALFERAAAAGALFLDVVGYSFWAQARAMLGGAQPAGYRGRYRDGGIKLMLDGSPQGKTAWLTQPYHVIPPGQPDDYRGYPSMTAEQVAGMLEFAFEHNWQVLAHCNGDAAAEQFVERVAGAVEAHGAADRRTVMIHAQTVRDDQLDRMAPIGMVPSFFASHVYYWGDYHRDSVLGPERAARISPMRSAMDRGLRFNIHNDAPVVPPDILRLVWSAAARRTRSGELLGPEQAISVEDALRAVTIDAAWAHFEEDTKGSLAAGKLADLVVLGADPTDTALEDIAAIPVLATLKEGAVVHGEL
jgi:predicted amidohydrolase YtcJ